jgi:hypothetical protein
MGVKIRIPLPVELQQLTAVGTDMQQTIIEWLLFFQWFIH